MCLTKFRGRYLIDNYNYVMNMDNTNKPIIMNSVNKKKEKNCYFFSEML